jgi:catechol 2,3-dioxygenase-like lactoylglutathione lyase family enzyme
MTDTLIFDQVHLGVPEPDAAARWYVRHLGATPGDHVDRVWIGATRLIFLKNATPAPSHGAAIDHFGLSVPSVSARLKDLEGSGARVTEPMAERPGLGRFALIEDPWGAKVQLIEEPEKVGFHHVHLQAPDPDRMRRWYLERFGGEQASHRGQLDGIRYGDVWVFMDAGPSVPSRGHTIDHIGWRMPDLATKAAELKNRGLTFTTEPQPGPPGPYSPVLMSFAEDPWGVKIELLQRRGE